MAPMAINPMMVLGSVKSIACLADVEIVVDILCFGYVTVYEHVEEKKQI